MPALGLLSTAKPGFGALLAAAGNFDFITSASGTAVSSLSVENCFSASYSHYLVMRDLLGSSAAIDLNVRLRVGGSDASGANYRYQVNDAYNTVVDGSRTTGATSWARPLMQTEATTFGYAAFWIANPFEAVRTTGWSNAGYQYTGNISLRHAVYAHDLETSYTGLTVLPASGTITGTIWVYGVKS